MMRGMTTGIVRLFIERFKACVTNSISFGPKCFSMIVHISSGPIAVDVFVIFIMPGT